MSNLEKYKNAFVEGLEVDLNEVEGLSMEKCDKWDSIGQMSLIAVLEDAFEIELEPEEVMAFTSYEAGMEILKNHQIEL
ncbi:MAG: acyl carrier protein [Bacteroidaceae bacterium]|nr:acyl carrier protein [Bacteroidaceae bacterium]